MPIYEYRRPDGTTFEVQQSFSDDPLLKDPDTGVPVERVLHPPALHFKGKGFYNTDYGTRNRQRETAAAAEGSGDSKGSNESKDSSQRSDAKTSSADGSRPGDSSSTPAAEKGKSPKSPAQGSSSKDS